MTGVQTCALPISWAEYQAGASWQEHFAFARAASTYKIQRLGNEAGLPTLSDIDAVRREFEVAA